jgi:hypothetical protein
MNEALSGEDALLLVKSLLGGGGIAFAQRESGELLFRLSDGGRLWETRCRAIESTVLFYGVYPFETLDRDGAAELCGEINAELTQGAAFFKDGRAVVRTGAELFDAYAAYEAAARALEYNAGVITAFWSRFAALRQI